MEQKIICCLFAAALLPVWGEHFSGKAEPFELKQVSIQVKSPEFQEAAQRLAGLLGKVLKQKVELKKEGNIIFEKKPFPDRQMYEIQSSAQELVLRAGTAMAADYAGADLLRELGYRRFAPHPAWEIIPKNPPKSIALNKRESPDYKMRSIWPGGGLWFDFRKRDNHSLWHYANRTGGLNLEMGHSYDRFILHNRKVFKEHPEYYALVKGKRNGSKLCISNPAVRKLFAEHAVEELRKRPRLDSVSADPSDGGGWCECVECARIGTPTDRAVLLANETAEAVVKVFPDKKVALYAYNQHSPPPSPGVKIHPAVVISIATGFIRQGWTMDALVREWSKRAEIGIREYYYADFEPGSGRACELDYLIRTIPEFHRKGARYMSAEASDAWGPGFPGYGLAAALLWNTGADPDAFLNDLYAKAFPESEKFMRQFYGLVLGSARKALSADLLHRMYDLLGQALKITSGSEKNRIEHLIGWTRFCELLFKHRSSPSEQTFTDLLEIAAAVKPSSVVHTFTIWRNERKALGFDGGGLAKKYDWDTPRKFNYEQLTAEGMKNNPKLDFEAVNFGYQLTAVTIPGVKNQPGILDGVRGRQQFYFHSDGNELKLEVTGGLIKHYRDRGNVKIDLIQLGGISDTGELETKVAHDESVPPDGIPRTVFLKPKYAGLHRLEIDDGNDMTRIKFPAGTPAAYPVPREKIEPFGSTFYFYVPKGTKVLGYYARTGRGAITAPDGKTFVRMNSANGYYSHPVPEKHTGKVWQVRNMKGIFRLLTVPDVLNLNSAIILVPETIVQKEGLKP